MTTDPQMPVEERKSICSTCVERGWGNPFTRGWTLGGLAAIPVAVAVWQLDGWMAVLGLAAGWALMFLFTVPMIEAALRAVRDK